MADMEKFDLLDDLIRGRISPTDADDLCSLVLADTSSTVPAYEFMGMSRKEWTACAHGAEFSEVAKWRANGWPNKCFKCDGLIVSDNYGWIATHHDGELQLKHVVCPKPT
jgi:hypothetical protein